MNKFNKRLTDKQKIEIVKLYRTGKWTCVDIGKKYGFTSGAIGKLLARRDIKVFRDMSVINRKYMLNQHYFDQIDTEEKAYFLGLLYADGCNIEHRYAIIIQLQENDKDLLERFKKAVNSNKPLGRNKPSKKFPHRKNLKRMEMNSKHMSVTLAALGCWAKKSLTLKWPPKGSIPDHLIRHFIRGYFDGDGSCGAYPNPDRPSPSYHMSFVGTLKFCSGLRKILSSHLDISPSIHWPKQSAQKVTRTITIGGRLQVLKVLDWLYKDATVFLKRKHDRYLSFKTE